MKFKKTILPLVIISGIFYIPFMTSCGKSAASPAGLDIEYAVLNLSPDLGQVNLYIDYKLVNTITPFSFEQNEGYFYVPSTDTPYQFRSALGSQLPIFNQSNALQTRAKYSLFIVGSVAENSLYRIFTVDTALTPPQGFGGVRFVNASPSATGGLDVYANGTLAFSKTIYKGVTNYISIPAGNYNFQTNVTNTTSVLNNMPQATIQNGRLYTLYAYGYTTRTDSAVFNVGLITNQ